MWTWLTIPSGRRPGFADCWRASVDFGAYDSPEAIRQLSPGDESTFLLFPSVVGAVVPIVNLPGVSSDSACTPEALAGIYLGKITRWNDPILRQANKGIRLPDLDVVVVHRADGSGTSYPWTDFLCKTVPDWKARVGSGLAPQWPIGRAAENEGLAQPGEGARGLDRIRRVYLCAA